MLAATAVFSLMIFLVSMILQTSGDHVRFTENRMHLQESLRESLYRMGLEIRESSPSRFAISNTGAVLTFQIPASVSNSGVITWSNPVTYRIGGNGTQLVRTDTVTNQTNVLANDIQNVVFAATGSPVSTITYTLTAQRTLIGGRVLAETSAGEAGLRNV
jgi:hypothetical protein